MRRHKIDILSLTLSIPFIALGALYIGGAKGPLFVRADRLLPIVVITVGVGIIASAVRALTGSPRDEREDDAARGSAEAT